jgi:hypothetical protein
MSLAADTRQAVRRNPFVFEALCAGVLNYTAAARYLDVGETETVTVALRRYAEGLPEHETSSRDARVTMQSGLGIGNDSDDALLTVGGSALVPNGGSLTGVLATGAVDAVALAGVLRRLAMADIAVEAAGVADGALVVVTGRRDGPDAVRIVENSLSAVPVLMSSTD